MSFECACQKRSASDYVLLVDHSLRGRLFESLYGMWPDALIENALDDSPPARLKDIEGQPLPDEFFVYRDEDSWKAWRNHGATDANSDQMLHVLTGSKLISAVAGGPQTKAIVCRLGDAHLATAGDYPERVSGDSAVDS